MEKDEEGLLKHRVEEARLRRAAEVHARNGRPRQARQCLGKIAAIEVPAAIDPRTQDRRWDADYKETLNRP